MRRAIWNGLAACVAIVALAASPAALAAKGSPVFAEPIVEEALGLLGGHFEHVNMDGPGNYARFLLEEEDEEEDARLRNEAVAVVRTFVAGLE